jgi:hypothetical protein
MSAAGSPPMSAVRRVVSHDTVPSGLPLMAG